MLIFQLIMINIFIYLLIKLNFEILELLFNYFLFLIISLNFKGTANSIFNRSCKVLSSFETQVSNLIELQSFI